MKGVIVISAGFKETGKEGALLEKEIARLAAKNHIPSIGPNCSGVINTELEMAEISVKSKTYLQSSTSILF